MTSYNEEWGANPLNSSDNSDLIADYEEYCKQMLSLEYDPYSGYIQNEQDLDYDLGDWL